MLKVCNCFLKKILIPLNRQNTELLLLYSRSWERNKGVRSVSVKRDFSIPAHMQTNLFLPKLFQGTLTFVTFPALARDVRALTVDGWPKWHLWKQITNWGIFMPWEFISRFLWHVCGESSHVCVTADRLWCTVGVPVTGASPFSKCAWIVCSTNCAQRFLPFRDVLE